MATNQNVADRLAKSVTEMHNIMKIRLDRNKQDLLVEHLTPPLLPVPVIRDLKGSHFQVLHPSTHIMQTMPMATCNLFFPLGIAISYRTNIAKTVWNMQYNKPELWISPMRYSNTTARHKSLITKAFSKVCAAIGMTDDEARASTYETLALADSTQDRLLCELEQAFMTNGFNYEQSLKDALRHGIHGKTRAKIVADAHTRLSDSFDRLTRDVPLGNIHERLQSTTLYNPSFLPSYEKTVQDTLARMDFLSYIQTLPLDEMRVVIRAQLELDKE